MLLIAHLYSRFAGLLIEGTGIIRVIVRSFSVVIEGIAGG
jgi:heme oxygenase